MTTVNPCFARLGTWVRRVMVKSLDEIRLSSHHTSQHQPLALLFDLHEVDSIIRMHCIAFAETIHRALAKVWRGFWYAAYETPGTCMQQIRLSCYKKSNTPR